ncbi:unnamed protein product [Rhodiola kirilowii]
MTPFEVVYGRKPPVIQDYLQGNFVVAAVDDILATRQQLLLDLKGILSCAQCRMKTQADRHRTLKEFQVDDWVFLKRQPYRQHSVSRRSSAKLAKRFYGPFKIIEHIGSVAYKLDLPPGCRIHNVFHASLLKLCRGDPETQNIDLPSMLQDARPIILPYKVLGFRQILMRGKPTVELLIQWEGETTTDAT